MTFQPSKTASGFHSRNPAKAGERFAHVVACLDGSSLAELTIPHAAAMAVAFDADLSLLQVLETQRDGVCVTDPMDWQMARLQASEYLDGAAARTRATLPDDWQDHMEGEILEGDPPSQIRRWVEDNAADLVVICTHGRRGHSEWPLASTARKLFDCLSCSMLVVPAAAIDAPIARPRYERVLVPLDGSLWSESALPVAVHLAKFCDASLILAHAVPRPELTRAGGIPPTAEDLDLEHRFDARNERVGHDYLAHLYGRLSATGLMISTIVENGGSVASELGRAIARTQPDLTVLPACGASGPHGVCCGSVAQILLSQARNPILLLRPPPSAVGVRPWLDSQQGAARSPMQATFS